jgi:hypothetical protein
MMPTITTIAPRRDLKRGMTLSPYLRGDPPVEHRRYRNLRIEIKSYRIR